MVLHAHKHDLITACVCCNGELYSPNQAKPIALNADLLIAADGGAKHLAAMHVKPHVIIGDMDSLIDDPWPNDESIRRIRFPQEKDQSDTELAIAWAFEQGVSDILLLAGTGGRFDHVLGHCALLLKYPGRVTMWNNGFVIRAITAGQHVTIRTYFKALISLIPFAEHTQVKTTGMQYNLNGELLNYATHGLSNMVLKDNCSISVSHGVIMLCAEGGDTWPH